MSAVRVAGHQLATTIGPRRAPAASARPSARPRPDDLVSMPRFRRAPRPRRRSHQRARRAPAGGRGAAAAGPPLRPPAGDRARPLRQRGLGHRRRPARGRRGAAAASDRAIPAGADDHRDATGVPAKRRIINGDEVTVQAIDAYSGEDAVDTPLFDLRALPLIRAATRGLEAQTIDSQELRRALAFDYPRRRLLRRALAGASARSAPTGRRRAPDGRGVAHPPRRRPRQPQRPHPHRAELATAELVPRRAGELRHRPPGAVLSPPSTRRPRPGRARGAGTRAAAHRRPADEQDQP